MVKRLGSIKVTVILKKFLFGEDVTLINYFKILTNNSLVSRFVSEFYLNWHNLK